MSQFKIATCGECKFMAEVEGAPANECRIDPPIPLSAYSSTYRPVKDTTPACSKCQPKPKPKAKPTPAKNKVTLVDPAGEGPPVILEVVKGEDHDA